MKNNLIKHISASMKCYFLANTIVLVVFLTSCDVIKKEPLDSIPDQEVWNSEGLTTLYLNDLYYLTMPTFSATSNTSYSDESPGGTNYMYGQLGTDDVGDFSSDTYSKIRRINILLEKIKTGTIPKSSAQVIIGQALFLRAWVYWNLVKLYGGVPMVMTVQDPFTNGDVSAEVKMPRNTTRECIELIADDLDSAYKYLPASWNATNYGRITRGAALALKGRMLLFWASPQFNPSNKTDRWQWAYDVNKMALDSLTKDGYGLNPSFKELFIDCKEKTKEAILVRVYDATIAGSFSHSYDKSVRPVAEGKPGGGVSNNATWNLVQAFPALNGYPITFDTTVTHYNQNRFWRNRDPRFAFTIAYNTCVWPLSGNATYKIWTYYNSAIVDSKVDTVSVEGANTHTLTGFYCRKYVNPSINKDDCDKVGTDWMEIRYAEVLLNFAECANELDGKSSEVLDALTHIHKDRTDVNVGMGYILDNINDRVVMREIIMNERQVEFAFENKRHWDLRRRNMFQDDLGPHVKKLNGTRRCGWKVVLNENLGETPQNMIIDRDGIDFNGASSFNYNRYFKGRKDTIDTQYPIAYPQPKYNFYAIPQTNIDKNPNLEQTSFWGGSFDPYKE